MTFALACAALLIEAAIGYPGWLLRTIGHPVIWIGGLIGALDRRLNDERLNDESLGEAQRRRRGFLALALLIGIPLLCAAALHFAALALLPALAAWLLLALLAASLPAQRSLDRHVAAVAEGLERDLEAGRGAVSHIVGRDVQALDEAGVARAAIESLAENFSDGVVAPAVWMGIGGLPGGVFYKAVNTADSMIGHRTPRHQAFGFAAARLDDLVNLPASRLSAGLILAAACLTPGASPRGAWRALRRDARHHRSPNAGWPEAAMAGALGLALAGPRRYKGVLVEDRYMGEGGRREVTAADIRAALRLYRRAAALLILLTALLAAAVIVPG